MRVTIQLPEDISAALEEQWDDVPRRSLEATAIEGYRSELAGREQADTNRAAVQNKLLGLEEVYKLYRQYTATATAEALRAFRNVRRRIAWSRRLQEPASDGE